MYTNENRLKNNNLFDKIKYCGGLKPSGTSRHNLFVGGLLYLFALYLIYFSILTFLLIHLQTYGMCIAELFIPRSVRINYSQVNYINCWTNRTKFNI